MLYKCGGSIKNSVVIEKHTPCVQKLCWAHSHTPSPALSSVVDVKTLAELRWKHGGWCMFRLGKADQSVQTGLFRGLTNKGAKIEL